jgi:hypothetical protein
MRKMLLFSLALTCAASTPGIWGLTVISSKGIDNANCGVVLLNPCLSLQAAYNDTLNGGIIKTIDAWSYSNAGFVVDRPMTIDGSGLAVLENINSTVSAPVLTITADCTIRGVVIHVYSGDAILIAASGIHVHLEDVTIQGVPGFFGNGVVVNSPGSFLTMNNVTITGATSGVRLESPTTFAGDHLHITRFTGIGLETEGGSATLRDSVISGPGPGTGSIGIYITGQGPTLGTLLAERNEVSSNGTGVEADNSDGPSMIRLSDMVITGNGTGVFANNGGQILSFRTNMIAGNVSDGAAPLGISLK